MTEYYSYIFVPKDMIPEQVCVQMGHVCMKMGAILESRKSDRYIKGFIWADYEDLGPENLRYVVTPAFTDFPELEEILEELNIDFEIFKDYNYTFEQGVLVESLEIHTQALMTYPIAAENRGILKGLPLWRAKK